VENVKYVSTEKSKIQRRTSKNEYREKKKLGAERALD